MIQKYEIYTANQPLCLGGQIYMFNRYNAVGAMVHMPDAQFTKGGHQNRINLLTPDGKPQMVVFPLKDRYLKKICECELSGPDHSFRKTLATFDALYSKFHHYKIRRDSFRNLFEVLRGSLYPPDITLWDLNQLVFSWVVAQIGLKLHVTETTVLTPVRPEHPSEWVAVMGAALGCKLYLGGGAAAAAYLRPGDFIKRDMAYVSQEYTMPPYKRTSTSTSTDAMVSILDPLFVGGADLVKELIDRPAWSRP